MQKIFHVHHRVCENNTLKEYLKQYNKNVRELRNSAGGGEGGKGGGAAVVL